MPGAPFPYRERGRFCIPGRNRTFPTIDWTFPLYRLFFSQESDLFAPTPRSPSLITGTGTDIVALGPFRQRLSPELIDELFLPDEQSYCRTQARPWENFAARFAAKEAAFKALGAGLQQGLRWHDVEVVRNPDGPVRLRLHGRAARLAAEQGVTASHLSLSHSSEFAVATVILENQNTEA